jgi:hypothetical protein
MATVPLPENPSLEQLKKLAKDLQRAVAAGDAAARAHVAEHIGEAPDHVPLSKAQLAFSPSASLAPHGPDDHPPVGDAGRHDLALYPSTHAPSLGSTRPTR